MALEAFRSQIQVSGPGQWLFPSDGNKTGHQTEFKKIWGKTLQRAGVPYFRLYDLRSTYATRLSAGGGRRRVGHADAAADGCAGIQEVLADETPDETGGAHQAQPQGQRVRLEF
jgi:integrase